MMDKNIPENELIISKIITYSMLYGIFISKFGISLLYIIFEKFNIFVFILGLISILFLIKLHFSIKFNSKLIVKRLE